jgi:hypothetical protein
MATKTWIRISFALGLCSALALISSNLALMEIQHKASDLTLEWRILHLSYAVFMLSHLSALVTLARMLNTKTKEHP